eukprot:TRINITY_DN6531_c0_g1_i3.p1 TRINITY_DN6531_c0_g1~~TRINITY_DN6531_c0_g1_i3.p1  ORF type:complete len:542 (+),score=158.69 TRINITY_DN6531_c0_g1_i3:237-1628(+)
MSKLLSFSFSYPEAIWPWSGFFAIEIKVAEQVSREIDVRGEIVFTVESSNLSSDVQIPIRLKVIPTPPRERRILWDQFHQLRYPSGFFPKDNLDVENVLDWNGDHPHTNFRDLFNYLTWKGYYVEILGTDFSCVQAQNYGTYLIVDTEDEFFEDELLKIEDDVKEHGTSLVVIADWYNIDKMKSLDFDDQNTKTSWTPQTGGANVPALNELLSPFGIELSDYVFKGNADIMGSQVMYAYGSSLNKFPAGGYLRKVTLEETTRGWVDKKASAAVLGVVDLAKIFDSNSSGSVAVYGDSNCLDSSHLVQPHCFELVEALIMFGTKQDGDVVRKLLNSMEMQTSQFEEKFARTPYRRTDINLDAYSRTLASGASPKCIEQVEEEVHLNSSLHVSRQRRKRNRKINVRPPVDFLPLESFTAYSSFTTYGFIFWLAILSFGGWIINWCCKANPQILRQPVPLSDTKLV